MSLRRIAVQVFAEQRRAIAGGGERDGECRLFVPVSEKRKISAVAAGVAENTRVVRVASGEDRRARRAAERIGDEGFGERDAVFFHLQHVRQMEKDGVTFANAFV